MCWVTQERSRLEVQRHLLFDVFFFWAIGSLSLMLSTSILLFEGVRTIQSGIILKHSGEKNQGHQINSLYCKTKGSAVSSGLLGYTQGHMTISHLQIGSKLLCLVLILIWTHLSQGKLTELDGSSSWAIPKSLSTTKYWVRISSYLT